MTGGCHIYILRKNVFNDDALLVCYSFRIIHTFHSPENKIYPQTFGISEMNFWAIFLITLFILYKANGIDGCQHSSPYSIYILNGFPMDVEGRRLRALREHNESLYVNQMYFKKIVI